MGDVLNDNRQLNSIQTSSSTITTEQLNQTGSSSGTVKLSLQKRKSSKKVVFTDDTVDNENLNRKKSKCCCIYEKPRTFDKSDSESDEDECDNCYGHKPHKKSNGNDHHESST